MAVRSGLTLTIFSLALILSACQAAQPISAETIDQDCLMKKGGSRLLSKAIGFGLGAAGVPGSGLAGRGVGYATKPQCEIFRQPPQKLTPPASHA